MSSLADLMAKFASPAGDTPPTTTKPAVVGDGHHKLASGGEKNMNSLADIYLAIAGQDHVKEASAAAQVPDHSAPQEDADFAKMAEQLAEQEAAARLDPTDDPEMDMVKVAAEYDSAGRIMARGFYDEFCKLAAGMTTEPDNQNTESESAAKTPALGERGLPTLETNYAGTVDPSKPGKQPPMTGPEPKRVYADSLETSKTISAGQGTGDDPEAAAISLGGGSPSGFATVRDLQA